MNARRSVLIWAVLLVASSANAENISVSLPCDPNTTATGFMRKCTDVIPELLTELDGRVLQLSKGFHQTGLSADPSHGVNYNQIFSDSKSTIDPQHTNEGVDLQKPVCSITANPLTSNMAEVNSNFVNESCGNPINLSVHVSKHDTSVTWYLNGKREGAYIRGMLIQALACYTAQVKNEVQNKKNLRITPACSSVAHDVAEHGKKSQDLVAGLKGALGSQKNIAEIMDCKQGGKNGLPDLNTWDSSGKTVGMDAGQDKQSAAYLCASRMAQESMFKQLMACEVFSRAGIDYHSFMNNQEALFAELKSGPGAQCRSQCYNQCKGCGDQGGCDSCATGCANQCYVGAMEAFFRRKNSRWPNNGSCRDVVPTASASADDLFVKKLMEVAVHEGQ